MAEIKPWERQTGETSKAYAAFQEYLNLGQDRSTRRVAEALSKSEALINRWSGRWDWPARSRAWDSMPLLKTEEAYADMAARIARQHERVATKLMAKLERNIDLLPEGADPSMRLSTAMTAARGSHAYATDLSKPADAAREEISKKIGALIEKLAGDD